MNILEEGAGPDPPLPEKTITDPVSVILIPLPLKDLKLIVFPVASLKSEIPLPKLFPVKT